MAKDMKEHNSNETQETDAPRSMSRRALLRRGVTAMPAVLTLQSGAALARSSNMISATTSRPKDAYGRTLCLDENSVDDVDRSLRRMDLGEPAYGRVTAIRDRDYRTKPRHRADRVSEARMCKSGGTYYYRVKTHDGPRWRKVDVPKGMLVSATALSSFAGNIVVTDL